MSETGRLLGGYADGLPPRAVTLGGGHGLSATLAALRFVTTEITAVVTVADDGGSSGRIRRELPVIPPGDLRMALAALAGDDPWGHLWENLLQHRFGGTGALAGHPVGNLVLTGLMDLTGDTVASLDAVARMVGAVGRVLPMSCVPLEILAEVTGIGDDPAAQHRIRGQVAVAATPGQVQSVSLVPQDPPPCPQAVEAVRAADVVLLGPGSWFTSVLPHLLVPELRRALVESDALRIVVLNLAPQPGETEGFTAQTHLDVLHDHAPDLPIDVVVADPATLSDPGGLATAVRRLGGRLVLRPVGMADGSPRHDPLRLAEAIAAAIEGRLDDAPDHGTQAENPSTVGQNYSVPGLAPDARTRKDRVFNGDPGASYPARYDADRSRGGTARGGAQGERSGNSDGSGGRL
ncbi:MAG: gluconeogenesis factor YvcK family protein [Mycobacteriales bacterium]